MPGLPSSDNGWRVAGQTRMSSSLRSMALPCGGVRGTCPAVLEYVFVTGSGHDSPSEASDDGPRDGLANGTGNDAAPGDKGCGARRADPGSRGPPASPSP